MNWNSKFWLEWCWFTFLPLTICVIHRFLTQENYKKKGLKSYTLDLITRILLFPSIIYYVVDSILILYQYNSFSSCNLGFLLHHIITLAGFKASLTIQTYPWFFLIVFPCHCLLIMFPFIFELNILYCGLAFYCVYRFLEKPWKDNKNAQWIIKIIIALMLCPIPILGIFDCKNDLSNVF